MNNNKKDNGKKRDMKYIQIISELNRYKRLCPNWEKINADMKKEYGDKYEDNIIKLGNYKYRTSYNMTPELCLLRDKVHTAHIIKFERMKAEYQEKLILGE